MPINPLLRAHQVGYILADCGARVLVTSAERLEPAAPTSSRNCHSVEHVIVVGGASDPVPDWAPTRYGWDAFRGDERRSEPDA